MKKLLQRTMLGKSAHTPSMNTTRLDYNSKGKLS